jgi:hypothetical protein
LGKIDQKLPLKRYQQKNRGESPGFYPKFVPGNANGERGFFWNTDFFWNADDADFFWNADDADDADFSAAFGSLFRRI